MCIVIYISVLCVLSQKHNVSQRNAYFCKIHWKIYIFSSISYFPYIRAFLGLSHPSKNIYWIAGPLLVQNGHCDKRTQAYGIGLKLFYTKAISTVYKHISEWSILAGEKINKHTNVLWLFIYNCYRFTGTRMIMSRLILKGLALTSGHCKQIWIYK